MITLTLIAIGSTVIGDLFSHYEDIICQCVSKLGFAVTGAVAISIAVKVAQTIAIAF